MRQKNKSAFIVLFVFSLFIFSYFGITIHNQKQKISELQKEKYQMEYDLEILNAKIFSLEKEINESDSLQFVEKIAREEYGMVKPKEVIFIDKDKLDKKGPYKNY